MRRKNREEKKNERKSVNKKESKIVTKESFCASIALFSFLAFVILCTRTLIFGEFGFVIHAFLTGTLGYFAYPAVLGVFYLSATGLFGKQRKNKKLKRWCIVFIFSAGLIAHTALTYSWFDDASYLYRCFEAGESFPKTTVCGWFGGIFVFAVASITTRVGALIVYGIITAFLLYICFTVAKKSTLGQATKQEKSVEKNAEAEIPLYNRPQPPKTDIAAQEETGRAQENYMPNTYEKTELQTPMQGYPVGLPNSASAQNENGGFTPTVTQRPGVSLREECDEEQGSFGNSRAFSPFGVRQSNEREDVGGLERSYENSRAFLFGGTPAENYRKNLIFDPNASVNRRPSMPTEHPTINNGYTPSYTDAYQNAINEDSPLRPTKIVNNQEQNIYENNVGYTASQEPISPPIVPMPPMQAQPLQEERTDIYDAYKLNEPQEPIVEDSVNDRGTELERGRDDGYRRHDYMDLFSSDNPNIFGGKTESPFDETLQRGFAERSAVLEERDSRENEPSYLDEPSQIRDGLNLLDDEKEDIYSLRSDFPEDRGSVDRGVSDNRFDSSFGFERETTVDRGRGFEEENERSAVIEQTPTAAMETKMAAPTPPKPRIIRPYVRVPLDDFDCRDVMPTANEEEVEETKQNIIATLEEFRVNGAEIASVTFGPTVTRYNVAIPRSISPKKVVALDQSIAISLHSSGVNVYPNYEDGVVSIEVPNRERQFVQLGCMLSGDTFVNAKSSSLMFTMGKDVANRKVYGDISKMIHLLVAGSSGSGKSVFLGSLIISLIYKYSPEELRLILIDPKMTEFVLYNGLPHLMINEIITDANKAVQSLNWAIGEMNRRYQLFEKMSRAGTYVVNLDQYNAQVEKAERLPKIVIIIDELADLMLAAKKEMEDRIQNLTQKARAAGIHLIVATQRPSTDVITGVIKSNLPTRVAFYVATDVDSRVILDQTGAQKLLGKGDFLYTMPGLAAPVRVQSAFISPEESQKVVNFIKNNNEAYYDEEATAYINSRGGYAGDSSDSNGGDKGAVDPMYIEALKYVILSGSASISMIQRKCSAGYNRAGKIIEWMEDMGYISPFDGAKARKVLITKEEFESKYGPLQ